MTDRSRWPAGALDGVRVLDLADELAAYSTRLLGDLGADVIRIEPPGGSRTRLMGPFLDDPPPGDSPGRSVDRASAFDRFVSAGKRSMTLDIATPEGRVLFDRLVCMADIVVETWSELDAQRMDLRPSDLSALNPRLIHVSVTPFGRDRARPAVDDDDLTIMAAGGLLNLGGYPDTMPLVAHGDQSANAASIFAAVGALTALFQRETTGVGQWVDVSAQECVAQALEDSVVSFEMTGRVRKRHGSDAAEAGTGTYPCADGLVSMVAGRVGTARAWRALVAWLVDEGVDGAVELQADEWSGFRFRQSPSAIDRFLQIFGSFTRSRTRQELYREAQSRGIALSPVNDVHSVLSDPQLLARGFWVTVHDEGIGRDETFPGPPYRLSKTAALPARAAPAPGADTAEILAGDWGDLDAGETPMLRREGAS